MTRAEREQQQVAGVFALIRDILSDKSIEAISYEDKHGAITVTRHTEREATFAIGFNADLDNEEFDEDEGDAE